jgi:hypothetical protein
MALRWRGGQEPPTQGQLLVLRKPGTLVLQEPGRAWLRPGGLRLGDLAEPDPGQADEVRAVSEGSGKELADLVGSIVTCSQELPEQVTAGG